MSYHCATCGFTLGYCMSRPRSIFLIAITLAGCDPRPFDKARDDAFYIRAAADYVATHDKRVVVSTLRDGMAWVRTVDSIPYSSGSELLRANPDCCTVREPPHGSLLPECVTRGEAVLVNVRWERHFRDLDGGRGSVVQSVDVGVKNNGAVCISLEEGRL